MASVFDGKAGSRALARTRLATGAVRADASRGRMQRAGGALHHRGVATSPDLTRSSISQSTAVATEGTGEAVGVHREGGQALTGDPRRERHDGSSLAEGAFHAVRLRERCCMRANRPADRESRGRNRGSLAQCDSPCMTFPPTTMQIAAFEPGDATQLLLHRAFFTEVAEGFTQCL